MGCVYKHNIDKPIHFLYVKYIDHLFDDGAGLLGIGPETIYRLDCHTFEVSISIKFFNQI